MMAASILGLAQSAQAAPTVTYPDAISSIQLDKFDGSDSALNSSESVRISAEWAVPDTAQPGETFGMALPVEFGRYDIGQFDITDPVSGVVMANCVVSDGAAPDVVCTLTADVIGIDDISGSFWMRGQVLQSTTEETVNFEVGDQIIAVDLPGQGGITGEGTIAFDTPFKVGGPNVVDGRMNWLVAIPGTYLQGGAFTVNDALDPNQENHHYTGDAWLQQRAVAADGTYAGEATDVDASHLNVTFSEDLKSFTATGQGLEQGPGVVYFFNYSTDPDGIVLDGDVFGNNATVQSVEVRATYTQESGGGGTGTGDRFTRFTLTKAVTGPQAPLAEDAEFTVRYSVKGSTAGPTTVTLHANQSIRSDRAPLGSTFVIEEIDVPAIDGLEWGAWTLTGAGVVPGADGTYEVTPTTDSVDLVLTNVANDVPVILGSISWTKTDPDGDLLSGSEWALTGPGGTVNVTDNGENDTDPMTGALMVNDLAFGEYELIETEAPAGFRRSDETSVGTVDATHLAISLGAVINTPLTPLVPQNPTPAEPGAPQSPPAGSDAGTDSSRLAVTGAEITPLGAIAAALLLTVGTVLYAWSRRRRTSTAPASEAETR